MNYQETLDFLYSRLPLFSRIGAAAYRKDLTNTLQLCKFLDNPEKKFPSIHIAGTNGKGSVSHMLAAILQEAGFKTGLYTSPHLQDFRERIRVNGSMIPEERVISFTERITPQIDLLSPSFFEITVAMAFEHFASEKVDIAVIETGLGGRLDSTNVIEPILSIITQVGMDHMNMLGDTIEAISAEKAGIIKKEKPVVVGALEDPALRIVKEKAASLQAPLYLSHTNRQVVNWKWEGNFLKVEVARRNQQDHQLYKLDLPGIYQLQNLITVLETCDVLHQHGWPISESHIRQALQQVKKSTGLHGRWELIHQHPRVILDVAHNEDGIRNLVKQLELTDHHHLHLVFGMVKDKEVEKILSLLPTSATYYFSKAQIPRAIPENELKESGRKLGLEGNSYPDVNTALDAAIKNAHPNDLVLVCGSVFLVGEVKR